MSRTTTATPGPASGDAASEGGAPASADIALPERPVLAPHVELSGAMQESGFAKQQWLVQRDGRFLQLTELLYRVAEQANGARTHDEIARAVSDAIGRKVSADNVRQLLRKLIPLGLIVQADGTVADTSASASRARSPLSVNMRMAMVSPRFIDPVTRFLQYLYLPPVLIVILLVAVAMQGWLFFVHGIAGAARQALAEPGLLLPLIGIIIVSTAWHEFGHAAALRRGGGQVRGMGAGLYLIYPAFYTDVTDNYRLGRWARVRTDLGGFYFNLIFTIGVIALYWVTHVEFLLIVVLLIDLEIVHQCLPFVRLDGYWALADLTGLPDFFSQIGPFLRTVLPLPWWHGPRLPALKGWVKAVFALYILLVGPLLAFLLFAMIKGVPRVLATGWTSFRQLSGNFASAQHSGAALGMATAAVQIGLLALPTLGTVYMLVRLGRTAGVALWRWSQPTPGRRALGSTISVAAVALLAFLWAPQLPFGREQHGVAARGPLYAAVQDNFVPIAPHERGAIPDVLHDVIVVQPPGGAPVVVTPAPVMPGGRPAGTPGNAPAPALTPTTVLTPTVPLAGTTTPTAPAGATGTAPTATTAAPGGGVTPAPSPTAAAGTTPTAAPTVAPARGTP